MPNRRRFLQQSSLAAAALLWRPNDYLIAKKEAVGLQLYTLRDEVKKDLKATIARIARIGYSDIETFGYSNGKYFGLSMNEFKTLLTDNKLTTTSGHYGLHDYFGKNDEDDLTKTVADARVLSHDFFTIPHLGEDVRASLDDYKKVAAKLNKAGEAARSAGMQLAYHNHNFEFKDWGNGKTGFDILMAETDPKLVSFEMDIYWVSRAGVDPIQLIEAHPGRFKMWHVKDMADSPEKEFAEVGSGVIPFKKIFSHRKVSGLRHFFVEQDVIKGDPYAAITKSLEYIKANLI